MQNSDTLDSFVNNIAHNVTIALDSDADAVLAQFEQQLSAQRGSGWTADDLGGVCAYSEDGQYVAWVDYENCVGYIA